MSSKPEWIIKLWHCHIMGNFAVCTTATGNNMDDSHSIILCQRSQIQQNIHPKVWGNGEGVERGFCRVSLVLCLDFGGANQCFYFVITRWAVTSTLVHFSVSVLYLTIKNFFKCMNFSRKLKRVGGRLDDIRFYSILNIRYYLDLSRQHNINIVNSPQISTKNGRMD